MASTTHLSRAELESHQLSALGKILTSLLATNSFYSEKLEAIGAPSNIESLNEFSEHVPFTFREDLVEDQKIHPPYGTNLTYPLDAYTRINQTSGTAGTPMRWLDTPQSWDWMLGNWIRVYQATKVTSQDCIFFPFSFGPFLGFWTAFEAATRLGCLSIPGGGLRSRTRLLIMLDHNVTVLCCTPTYALYLAEVARRENIDLANTSVRLIVVAGEPGGSIASTRQRIESFWNGARLVDHHGMTEIGPVSYQCPRRPGVLHVIESSFYPEIVDPKTGYSTQSGELGELVLTNLGRLGSPLLRYRTGDLVRSDPSSPCSCGTNELSLVGGIVGRMDDMIVVRGVNLFPSAIEEIVRSMNEVVEYQVTIHRKESLFEVSLQIEPTPECLSTDQLTRKIEGILHAKLSLRIHVSAVAPETLPRFELKASRWIMD